MFEPGRFYSREWAILSGDFLIPRDTPLFCIRAFDNGTMFGITFLYSEKIYTFRDTSFSLVHWRDAETNELVTANDINL